MNIPSVFEMMTADDVAETVSFLDDDTTSLYRKLWGFSCAAINPTPLGSDLGGTLDNDDKATHWWSKLSEGEQEKLVVAARKDGLV